MLVASRYCDPSRRGLISPQLFPFYWFTMRACVVIAPMTVVTVLFSQVDLRPAQYARLLGAGALMVLPFCALGLALGASLRVAAALALANVGWIGLAMLGGLLFPIAKSIAMWTPTYYAGQLNKGIVGLPTEVPVWISVAVLSSLGVRCGLLAMYRINAAKKDD
jgi:ABC-2 type transport system permease protein